MPIPPDHSNKPSFTDRLAAPSRAEINSSPSKDNGHNEVHLEKDFKSIGHDDEVAASLIDRDIDVTENAVPLRSKESNSEFNSSDETPIRPGQKKNPDNASEEPPTPSIENNADNKDLAESTGIFSVGIASLPEAKRQEQIWRQIHDKFFPGLGKTPEEEKAIFLESLDHLTRDVEGDEQHKAVLIHIQKRFKETGFSYGEDIDTEGVREYASTVSETLQDEGQAIDCEDFAIMARFWGDTAIEGEFLPADSKFHIVGGYGDDPGNGHTVCVYESTDGDKYIIDGTLYDSDGGGDPSSLLTLSEYRDGDDRLKILRPYLHNYESDHPHLTFWTKKEDEIVTEEWLNQSSESPIDESISSFDLDKKIYAAYSIHPDNGNKNFAERIWQYGNGEFWQDKFDDKILSHPALGIDAASAIAEGTLATGYALYKRHKVMRRRFGIVAAHAVKKKWDKLPVISQPMEFSDFQDFARMSHLVDDRYDSNIKITAEILNCHKNYQTYDDFLRLVDNLQYCFSGDNELNQLRNEITEEALRVPAFINGRLEKILKHYGISVEYKKAGTIKQKAADKFRKKEDEKLKACLHKTVIDKGELYKNLMRNKRLLQKSVIKKVVVDHREEIDTLYNLKNYDDWKLRFTRNDTIKKSMAAVTGIIPLIPIDEFIRVGSCFSEEQYRKTNNLNMKSRVLSSLCLLKENKQCFSSEEYQQLYTCLKDVKALKNRHIKLKKAKARRMQEIHSLSAIAALMTDPLGPVGSGVRNAVKGSCKISNSVYPMIRRYQGDNASKKANRFHTVRDVYKFYKRLYLKADPDSDIRGVITELAKRSFDLAPDEFEILTRTSMIENNRFKLSLSKPFRKGDTRYIKKKTGSDPEFEFIKNERQAPSSD